MYDVTMKHTVHMFPLKKFVCDLQSSTTWKTLKQLSGDYINFSSHGMKISIMVNNLILLKVIGKKNNNIQKDFLMNTNGVSVVQKFEFIYIYLQKLNSKIQ